MANTCPECGKEVAASQRFCKYCGAPCGGGSQAAPAPPPTKAPASPPPTQTPAAAAPTQAPAVPHPATQAPVVAPAPPQPVAQRPASGGIWILLVLALVCLAGVALFVIARNRVQPWDPHLALTASAAEITRGQPCALDWSGAEGVGLRLDGEPVPPSGSRAVWPARTTTYRLAATGPRGQSAFKEITVRVNEPAAPPAAQPGADLDRTPPVPATDRAKAPVEAPPAPAAVRKPERTKKAETVPAAPPPAASTTAVSVTTAAPPAAVAATPAAPLPQIVAFEAAPANSIQQCQMVVLRWTVRGASRILLEPGFGQVAAEGWRPVRLPKTTPYVLKADGPGGPVTRTVTIAVAPGTLTTCGR